MRQDCPLPAGSTLWIYCRHSPGDEQDLGSQVRAAEAYCETHSLVIGHIFKDIAKEGDKLAGRDGLIAMHEAARQEPRSVDGIAFWKFARVFRGINLAQFYIASWRLLGYEVFSMTEYIPPGPEGALFETMIHYANQKYKQDLRENVTRGLHDLARMGYAPGGKPPKGYLAERAQIGYKSSGAPKFGTVWVPDPEMFHLAQRAWEMRVSGATYHEIHAAIPFYKQARCWADFYKNKTYLGVRKCGDIEVPNSHPAACTQEQWDTVQEMRKRARGGAYPRQVSSGFVLSGLLECEYCGGSVVASTTGAGYRYYVCGSKPNFGWGTCEAKSISARRLDKGVVTAVLDHILTPPRFYELVDEVNRQLAADQNGLEPEIRYKGRELAEAAKRIANLTYAVAAGSLAATKPLLVEEKRQAQLEAELGILHRRASQQRIIVDDATVSAKLTQMRLDLETFTSGNVGPTQRFLKSFVSRVVVGRKSGVLYYHMPMIQPRNHTSIPKEVFPIESLQFAYA